MGCKRLLQSSAKDTKTTLKHSGICRHCKCLFVCDTDTHERNQITDDKAASVAGFEGRAQIQRQRRVSLSATLRKRSVSVGCVSAAANLLSASCLPHTASHTDT